MSFKCCTCCDHDARNDHVQYGGTVEVNGHDGPCTMHDDEPEPLRSKLEELCKTSSGKVWATDIDLAGFVLVKDILALLEED